MVSVKIVQSRLIAEDGHASTETASLQAMSQKVATGRHAGGYTPHGGKTTANRMLQHSLHPII